MRIGAGGLEPALSAAEWGVPQTRIPPFLARKGGHRGMAPAGGTGGLGTVLRLILQASTSRQNMDEDLKELALPRILPQFGLSNPNFWSEGG